MLSEGSLTSPKACSVASPVVSVKSCVVVPVPAANLKCHSAESTSGDNFQRGAYALSAMDTCDTGEFILKSGL